MACKNKHSDVLFFVRKEASISDPVAAGEVCKVAYHRSEIPIILDLAWRAVESSGERTAARLRV